MSNNLQNVKCGWTGCSHRFGSEIDMNMHVMMNHMCVLDHGEFVLNRRVQNRKRHAREPSPLPAPLEEPAPESQPPTPQPPIIRAPALKLRKIAPEVLQRNPLPLPVAPPQEQKPVIHHHNVVPDTKSNFQFLEFPRDDRPAINAPGPSGAPGTSGNHVKMDQRDHIPRDEEVDMQLADNQQHINLANPQKLSEVVDEFLERLRPMKQLGFIRPNRTVYCIVCLKYVRSFHECNWRHTPAEDRIAEMWYRRYGPEKPTGKSQLARELEEIRMWLQTEEEKGIAQPTL